MTSTTTRLLLSTLMTLILWPSAVAAQTVDIESMSADKPGFGLSLGGALDVVRGNANQFEVGTQAHLQYQLMYEDEDKTDKVPAFLNHRWMLTGSAEHATATGEVIQNERFAHARWTAMWLKRIGSEVFAQYQFAELARLKSRILVGTGARFVLFHDERLQVHAGSGYMLEREDLTAAPGEASAPGVTLAHRWTNFLSVRAKVATHLAVSNTLYAQPRFDDFNDYRIFNDLIIKIAITKHVALATRLTVTHDSKPPTGVVPTNLDLTQGVQVEF